MKYALVLLNLIMFIRHVSGFIDQLSALLYFQVMLILTLIYWSGAAIFAEEL